MMEQMRMKRNNLQKSLIWCSIQNVGTRKGYHEDRKKKENSLEPTKTGWIFLSNPKP